MIYRSLLIGLLACTPLLALNIIHEPLEVMSMTTAEPISVQLSDLSEAEQNAQIEVFFHYKMPDEEAYTTESLPAVGNQDYQLLFNPITLTDELLDYYISVQVDGKEVATLPQAEAPQLPFVVELLNEADEIAKTEPIDQEETPTETIKEAAYQLRLLSPEPDKNYQDGAVSLLIGIEDPEDELSGRMRLFLNKTDITRQANLSSAFVSFVPNFPLKEGQYLVTLYYETKAGNTHQQNWSFAIEKPKKKTPLTMTGTINWDNYVFSSSKPDSVIVRNPLESRLTSVVNIKGEHFLSRVAIRLDSRENKSRQPLNRIGVTFSDKKKYKNISIGDTTPVLSQLTLNGRYVRGIDMEWDLSHYFGLGRAFQIRYLTGETNRAIKAGGAVTAGTYRQSVQGLQATLRKGNAYHKFTYTLFRDDLSSLSSSEANGTNAQENHIFSISNKFKLFDATQITHETAASIFYNNLESALVDLSDLDLPVSEEMVSKITDIFPARSSLFFGIASMANIKTPLPYKGLSFIGDVRWVQPGFNTLGNTGLRKNVLQNSGTLVYRLLDNRMTLRYGIKELNDNVLNKPTPTLHNNTNQGSLSYRFDKYGSFSLAKSFTQSFNLNSDKTPVSGTSKIDSTLNNWTMSHSGIPAKIGATRGKLGFNLSLTFFEDKAVATNSFDNSSYGSNYSTQFGNQKLTLGLSQSQRLTKSVLPNTTTYSTFSSRLAKTWVPRVFTGFGSIRYTKGSNNGADSTRHINNTRWIFSLGTSFRQKKAWALKNTRLNSSIDYTLQSDDLDPENSIKNFSDILVSVRYSGQF